jgi:hypothetical protein
MLLERKTWGWSPLYHAFTKAEGGFLSHIKHPFRHTNEELVELLSSVVEDILPRLELAPVPPPILAMKLLACMWTSPAIPLLCPIQGATL